MGFYDGAGIGTDEQKKAAANWTVNTHIFDNILKNLKVVSRGAIDVRRGEIVRCDDFL